MNAYRSHADLGGSSGHGAVDYEPEGVVFHHEWEARALALTLAAGAPGGWNIDMSRRARETLADYASLTYYEIWTAALEALAVEHGLVTEDELSTGHVVEPGEIGRRVLRPDQVDAVIRRGGPADRPVTHSAAFDVGDSVRTRSGPVDHHTRLPAYAAGHVGTIERVHGAHVFPDANAHGLGEQPHWLYAVAFDAADLWPEARRGDVVSIDAWEPYLEAAT